MNPYDIVRACDRAGVRIWLDGGALRYECAAGVMPESLRRAVETRRPEVIECLRRIGRAQTTPVSQWSEADRELYEERAAIREFEGGMSRADAEREAEADVRKEMLRGYWAALECASCRVALEPIDGATTWRCRLCGFVAVTEGGGT